MQSGCLRLTAVTGLAVALLVGVLPGIVPRAAAAAYPDALREEFPSLFPYQQQTCDVATIRLVLAHLQQPVDPIRNGTGYKPEARDVRAAACADNPSHPDQTLVALLYTDETASDLFYRDENRYYDSDMNVTPIELAIVDTRAHRIIASDDAGLESWTPNPEIDDSNLRLDTARYQLAPGVRAFGVDMMDGYNPNCGDGHIGPSRALYVRDGTHVRRILPRLTLSHDWVMQESNGGRCGGSHPELQDVVEHSMVTLAMAGTMHHGWHDIWAQHLFWVNDEPPAARCRVKLVYNGEEYSALADQETACSRKEDAFVRAIAERFHVEDWLDFGAK